MEEKKKKEIKQEKKKKKKKKKIERKKSEKGITPTFVCAEAFNGVRTSHLLVV